MVVVTLYASDAPYMRNRIKVMDDQGITKQKNIPTEPIAPPSVLVPGLPGHKANEVALKPGSE